MLRLECPQNSFGKRRTFNVAAVVELPDNISLNLDMFVGFSDMSFDLV
jgi:hypothetical protein